MSVYSIAPLLGSAFGPIAGRFIALKTTWNWFFWSTSIVDFAIQALGLIYLQENYLSELRRDFDWSKSRANAFWLLRQNHV